MRNLLSGIVSGACLVVLWAVLTHKPGGTITIADEPGVPWFREFEGSDQTIKIP